MIRHAIACTQRRRIQAFLCLSLCSLYLSSDSLLAADPPKAPKKITYQDNIQPILREKCFACHDSDKLKGGLDVTSFTKLMEGGGSGAVVKPGDANGSRMLMVVSHKVQPFMPPKSDRLPQQTLDTIRLWIEQGALENAGSKAIALKPKTDVGLTSVVRGRPAGPPPMPLPGKLAHDPVLVTPRANAVTAMAANPWSPLVAVAGHRQVLLYNSDSLQLEGVLPFPYGLPAVLKFSRNGSLLLAAGGRGGQSGKAVVWSVLTGEKVVEVGDETDSVLAADISADQTQIALGGPNKLVRIYSTRDGEKIREIKKHTDWIYALEYSPDGVLLASADRNGGVFVWEAFTGREYFSLRGHTAAVTDVSWRDDSNVLATCSEDSTVRLWEMENGGQIRSWGAAGGGVESVRFSHDGRIATVGRDRLARIWDQAGAQKAITEPFPDLALRVAVTHDSAKMVAGDWTGLVRFFITADGKTAGAVTNNPPPVAEQFELAMKDLAARQATYDQAKSAADASSAALNQANANLAAAQKALADSTAAVAAATAAMNQAKAAAEQAKTVPAAAQAKIAAKETTLKAVAEAGAKIKAAADQAKNDAAMQAELASFQKLVAQATAEVEAARKALADANAAVTATAAKFTESQKALAAAQASAASAPKLVETRTAEVKAATAKSGASAAAFNDASASLLTATKAAVDKFKALPPKK
jgi:WD40 repeat protein